MLGSVIWSTAGSSASFTGGGDADEELTVGRAGGHINNLTASSIRTGAHVPFTLPLQELTTTNRVDRTKRTLRLHSHLQPWRPVCLPLDGP